MHSYFFTLLIYFTFCTAWLPNDRGLFNGQNSTSSYNSTISINSTHSNYHAHVTRHTQHRRGDRHRHSSKRSNKLLQRWLPGQVPIRGVNLGSQFIAEPWMANDEWNAMGCAGTLSEFDCVSKLGQAAANSAFQAHWARWTTQADIEQMQSYGINTIRIPVGYWMKEDLVYASEHFPQGGLQYLEQICGWASDAGFYIIIDLHGAPGAQVAQNPNTGQYASCPGFYVDWNYQRAYEFLAWMANIIHTNNNYRNVGMLEIVNEPVQDANTVATMLSEYYPTAYQQIRAAESALNVGSDNLLHVQVMNQLWDSGNPNQYLTDLNFMSYDDHRYIKWANPPIAETRAAYLAASCNDNRGGNWPTVVGEWSLSVADDAQYGSEFDPAGPGAIAWYQQWWAAQVRSYEQQDGWIFWSWKANWIGGVNDWRWSYQAAVAAGAIPTNPSEAAGIAAAACGS